jgi:hypothetical protein
LEPRRGTHGVNPSLFDPALSRRAKQIPLLLLDEAKAVLFPDFVWRFGYKMVSQEAEGVLPRKRKGF